MTGSSRFSRSVPLQKSLQWLPVQYRIIWSVLLLNRHILENNNLVLPMLGLVLFLYMHLLLGITLPSSIKSLENIAKFRRHLKHTLCKFAYPPQLALCGLLAMRSSNPFVFDARLSMTKDLCAIEII